MGIQKLNILSLTVSKLITKGITNQIVIARKIRKGTLDITSYNASMTNLEGNDKSSQFTHEKYQETLCFIQSNNP